MMLLKSSLIESDHIKDSPGCLADVLKDAVYGVCLTMKKQVVTTHTDLIVLRRCAELLLKEPGRHLKIMGAHRPIQTHYLIKTLLHLGVSCRQIFVYNESKEAEIQQGLWLVVAS